MSTGRDMWEMAAERTIEALERAIFDIEESHRGENAEAVRVPVMVVSALVNTARVESSWDTAAFETLAGDLQSIIAQTVEGTPFWRVASAVAGVVQETRADWEPVSRW